MKKQTRRRYTDEFKAQAVELLQAGRPAAELSRELGIGVDLIYAWNRSTQSLQVRSEAACAAGDSGAAQELQALRHEVALLR